VNGLTNPKGIIERPPASSGPIPPTTMPSVPDIVPFPQSRRDREVRNAPTRSALRGFVPWCELLSDGSPQRRRAHRAAFDRNQINHGRKKRKNTKQGKRTRNPTRRVHFVPFFRLFLLLSATCSSGLSCGVGKCLPKARCRLFAAQRGQPLNPLRQALRSLNSVPPWCTISPS